MRRRVLALCLLLALIGAACGSDKKDTSSSGGADTTEASGGGGAETYGVSVDHEGDGYNGFFIAYFPKEVTAHPGDEIDFSEVFTGEPHSVTFGTLVDTGLAEQDKMGKDAEDEAPTLKKIPHMLPDGPGDAIQTAAQPCFLATGEPPTDGAACPKVDQPEFDGKHALYSSGFLPDGETFKVKLAKDLAPGTYRFFCDLHRAGMQGKITVVAKDAKADSADDVSKRADTEFEAMNGALKSAAAPLAKLTADTAQAGAGVEGIEGGVADFGPKDLSIPVGGSVTWDVQGPHTISFNVPEDARTFIAKAPDGSVHLNPKAGAPAGGPGAPEGPPPEKPTVIDGGTWNGDGFRNTGFLPGFGPPGFLKFKMSFSKAGTYKYACLVHPDMLGTLKVG